MANRVGVAADVARIGIFRHQLERHLLAAAADPQRRIRLAHTFRLVDRLVDGVVLARKGRIVFRPHLDQNLSGLAEGPHALARLREPVAIRAPFVLVPARAEPAIQPAMAHHIHCGGHLRQQRGIAIAVTGHHLPDIDTRGIAHETRRAHPGFEGGLQCGPRYRVEVVVDPNRVEVRDAIGFARHPCHRLVLLDGVTDVHQIHPPPLRDEHAETHAHEPSSPDRLK